MSHSTVQLPVASYQQRLKRMASDFARQELPQALQLYQQQQQQRQEATSGAASSSAAGQGAGGGRQGEAEAVLEAIQRYLYDKLGFRVAAYGRSNLPEGGERPLSSVLEPARSLERCVRCVSACSAPCARLATQPAHHACLALPACFSPAFFGPIARLPAFPPPCFVRLLACLLLLDMPAWLLPDAPLRSAG